MKKNRPGSKTHRLAPLHFMRCARNRTSRNALIKSMRPGVKRNF